MRTNKPIVADTPETEVSTFNQLYFCPLLKMGGLPILQQTKWNIKAEF